MKITQEYVRSYGYGNIGHIGIFEDLTKAEDNQKDTIITELSKNCLKHNFDFDVNTNDTRKYGTLSFLWFESGLFRIVVSREHIHQKMPYDSSGYKRKITIESMPPEAQLPQGLVKLLTENGFTKVEPEKS